MTWYKTKTEELKDASEKVHLTEQEIREFAGVLNPRGTDAEKIQALEIEVEHFRMEALRETDADKEGFYRGVSETAALKADSIRLKIGLSPEHDKVKSIVTDEMNNDDLGRLERFKRWARENLFGLSAVAISIAGIITTVVMGVRKAVVAGAKATSKFAKALAKLAKEVGPVLSGLLNLLAQVISLGSRAVSWLAGNLWVLAVAFAWYVYERRRNKT